MNRKITGNKVDPVIVIKNTQQTKAQDQKASLVNSIIHLKKN